MPAGPKLGPPALPVLHAGGFTASVDAYAWERDPDPAARRMRLWFVSLLGPQQTVRALWARLVKGEVATVSDANGASARFCALAPEPPKGWRLFTAGLPAASGHQAVVVPEAALFACERPDFLLLPRDREEAADLHWRFLNRRLDLPMHASWAAWLWRRALAEGEAAELEAFGVCAFRCRPDRSRLAGDLSAAVRAGGLRLPDALPPAA
jgi:hypothetical protein